MSEAVGTKSFAEFFAGIGLVRAGLAPSGWRCVYANDIAPEKASMYRSHFRDTADHYHVGDVRQVEAIVERMGNDRPFLATASFPCVDLSLAGHWRGLDGEQSSTFFGFTKVLARLGSAKPAMVMLENVPGLLTSNHGKDFHRVIAELSHLGYWIDAIILDARRFVPQSRPRLFVFGYAEEIRDRASSKDLGSMTLFETPSGIARDVWASELRPVTLVEALQKASLATGLSARHLPTPPPFVRGLLHVIDQAEDQDWWAEPAVTKHLEMMETPSRDRVMAALRSGESTVGAAFRRTRRGATRLEVRFDVAGCLRTPKGGSAKQIILAIARGELRMRWMSPREYARLQGASDYVIDVPPLQAMYGFGDAVCVPVIQWIDNHLLSPCYSQVARELAKNPRDVARIA